MVKKYRVTLTVSEREELAALLGRGKADMRKLKHAQVLLHADEGEAPDGAGSGPGWCDSRLAEAVGIGPATVQRVRQRFVEDGFAAALSTYRTGGRVYGRKLDGAQADAVSHETVRQVLKKHPQAAPAPDVVHPAQAVG